MGDSGQYNLATVGNSNYNYPQFPNFQSTNCGWQANTFPDAWNLNNPMNQFFPQCSGSSFDPQFTTSQSFNQNLHQNFNRNFNQYHSQAYMRGYQHYDNRNHSYSKFNQKDLHNRAPCHNSKTPTNNWSNQKQTSQKMRTHYCDTCDKSFPTEENLATHLSEHKVCGLDGCKFTAHPKVVDKHQQLQHFTGLYRRIGSLYTPEDIEKWRKERKK